MENTINLYGSLARKFEKKYKHDAKGIKIAVRSPREMMSALEANFPGFKTLMKKTGYYRVAKGESLHNGQQIKPKEVEMRFSKDSWHMMPIAAGCGDNGFFSVVLGIVLVVISYLVPAFAPIGYKLGAALILGGIAQMLSPNPAIGNYGDNEKPDENPSYLFDGPVNSVEPGLTIPVAYGHTFVGSISVSGGIRITDLSTDIVEDDVDFRWPHDDDDKYGSGDSDKWPSAPSKW